MYHIVFSIVVFHGIKYVPLSHSSPPLLLSHPPPSPRPVSQIPDFGFETQLV